MDIILYASTLLKDLLSYKASTDTKRRGGNKRNSGVRMLALTSVITWGPLYSTMVK